MSPRFSPLADHFLVLRCSPIIVLALVALAAAPARAGGRQAEERSARMACLTGDYTKGVAILAKLFIDTEDPTYLFNQGRCFEQNRRYEDAIARFEEYLRTSEGRANATDRAAAEKHIADCNERLPDQARRAQPPAPAPIVPPPTAPVAAPAAAPTPPPSPEGPPMVAQRQLDSGRRGSGLRVAGIVTASVGVAAGVAGVIFNLKANGIVNDMETTPTGSWSTNDKNRKQDQTLAWVGYGVGAACVVTGAILFGIGMKPGEQPTDGSASSVALFPMIGPGQAGAALTGAF